MSAAGLAGQAAAPGVSAVAVRDLQVEIAATGTPVISEVTFGIAPGEILGVVGESGSGKTTVGLALLGHARRGLRIAGGSVLLGDHSSGRSSRRTGISRAAPSPSASRR